MAVILICLNFYIYFLSRSFTHNNFYTQLKDRANITATVFLEADEESANVIKAFQKKNGDPDTGVVDDTTRSKLLQQHDLG